MIHLRTPLPPFEATALSAGREIKVTQSHFKGGWFVIVFYTHDETSICASELTSIADLAPEFEKLGAKVVAVSVDSLESHKRWRDSGTGKFPFLWIADESKEVARKFDVLHEDTGLALRGTFIVDPDGWVRFASVHDLPIGRNTGEILRTLQALQTGQSTQCNWKPGEPTV
jgi:alkyl hydroperoxide reductase subunit AhpC